jgi:NTP pyrophosphatase (non-canonical NTP hydrolase)
MKKGLFDYSIEQHTAMKEKGFYNHLRQLELLRKCVTKATDLLLDHNLVINHPDLVEDMNTSMVSVEKNYRQFFVATQFMLMVSELSEALEALRKGDRSNMDEELADVFLRLADFCGSQNVYLEIEVEKKMAKNRERDPLHGKKF